MAITLGSEMALALHLDDERSYGDVEAALVDAGFTDYTIMRNVNYDGSADIQIYVRHARSADGNVDPLEGADTLAKLTDVLTALDEQAGEQDNEQNDTPAAE